jgi:uncharacterized Zn finger protein
MASDKGMVCPDCGCRPQDHNAVARVRMEIGGDAFIPHCRTCGACWNAADTRFVIAVRQAMR